MNMPLALPGPDGHLRCRWCMATPEYLHYHDTEWGFPTADDQRLFEKLCLEGFQAGLSWRTVLEKRQNLRLAFHGFDLETMAAYTDSDIDRLVSDASIIRHRGKITAAINNARRAIELIEREGSLAAFVWRYEPDTTARTDGAIVTVDPESTALSKELKKRGWQFVGPTTIYSFMQAMGLVNDHAAGCIVREQVEEARRRFSRPVP